MTLGGEDDSEMGLVMVGIFGGGWRVGRRLE